MAKCNQLTPLPFKGLISYITSDVTLTKLSPVTYPLDTLITDVNTLKHTHTYHILYLQKINTIFKFNS